MQKLLTLNAAALMSLTSAVKMDVLPDEEEDYGDDFGDGFAEVETDLQALTTKVGSAKNVVCKGDSQYENANEFDNMNKAKESMQQTQACVGSKFLVAFLEKAGRSAITSWSCCDKKGFEKMPAKYKLADTVAYEFREPIKLNQVKITALGKYTADRTDYAKRLEECTENLTKKTKEWIDLRARNAKDREINAAEKKKLQDRINVTNHKIKKKIAQTKTLQGELAAATKTVNGLLGQLAKAQKMSQANKAAIKKRNAAIKDLNDKLTIENTRKDEADRAYADAKADNTRLEQEKKQTNQTLTSSKAQLIKATEKEKQAAKKKRIMEEKARISESIVAAQQKRILAQNKTLTRQKVYLAKQYQANNKLRADLKELNKKNSKLAKNIREKDRKIKENRAATAKLQKALASEKKKLQKEKATQKKLQKDLMEEKRTNKLTKFKMKITEQILTMKTGKLESVKKQLATAQTKLTDVNKKIDNANAQLETERNKKKQLKIEYNKNAATITQKDNQIQKLQKDLLATNQKIGAAYVEKQNLQNDLNDAASELKTMTERTERVRAEVLKKQEELASDKHMMGITKRQAKSRIRSLMRDIRKAKSKAESEESRIITEKTQCLEWQTRAQKALDEMATAMSAKMDLERQLKSAKKQLEIYRKLASKGKYKAVKVSKDTHDWCEQFEMIRNKDGNFKNYMGYKPNAVLKDIRDPGNDIRQHSCERVQYFFIWHEFGGRYWGYCCTDLDWHPNKKEAKKYTVQKVTTYKIIDDLK